MINTTAEPSNAKLAGVAWLDRGLEWIKYRERAILIVGIGFQLVVLIAMIVTPFTTLITGDTILLARRAGRSADLFPRRAMSSLAMNSVVSRRKAFQGFNPPITKAKPCT